MSPLHAPCPTPHAPQVRLYCIHKGLPPDVLEDEDPFACDEFSFTQQDRRAQALQVGNKDFAWARPVFEPHFLPRTLEHSTKMVALFEIIAKCMELGEKVPCPLPGVGRCLCLCVAVPFAHQTCHWRAAGELVLSGHPPRIEGHSVIPAPRTTRTQ